MKKFYFVLGVLALTFALNTAFKAAAQDSISITIYADCRDFENITAEPGSPDSAANAHNASQYVSYDPAVLYLTGSWTPGPTPGDPNWTFFTMDSIAPHIFSVTFKYAPGQFAGNEADDPDLLEDCPAWYFCPTNDWSTAEYVPAPCNICWDVQRIFYIDVYQPDPDTVVAFKYGVCDPVPLESLGLPWLGVNDAVNENNLIIYPNPSDGVIHVDLTSFAPVASIEVLDLAGRVVSTMKNASGKVTLNITGMPSSLYFIRVNDGIHSIYKKVVLK
ncbi:MAG: T9SS type A sorting domain-containing protein [Bacteroidales bacterium]|nr:T9SS type A sorting domain-containing protein [Bacteroidales bacterium]